MDILIACHCKDTHKSILIIDLETLQPYSINEPIGAVTEIATPEMLLQKFNIGSISYIDISNCEDNLPDQFTKWDDIATGSIDKIITIYCSGYVEENVNRILKPDGKISASASPSCSPASSSSSSSSPSSPSSSSSSSSSTSSSSSSSSLSSSKITFWGLPENIANFTPTPTIQDGDTFLFVPYDEWRKIRCNKIILPHSDPDYDPEDDVYRNKVIGKLTNLTKTLEPSTKACGIHKARKRKTKSKRKKKITKTRNKIVK